MFSLNLEYTNYYSPRGDNVVKNSYYSAKYDTARNIAGYDKFFNYSFSYWLESGYVPDAQVYNLGADKTVKLSFDPDLLMFNAEFKNKTLQIPLKDFILGLDESFTMDGVDPNGFVVSGENNDLKMSVYFTYLNIQKDSEGTFLGIDFDSEVFLKLK